MSEKNIPLTEGTQLQFGNQSKTPLIRRGGLQVQAPYGHGSVKLTPANEVPPPLTPIPPVNSDK